MKKEDVVGGMLAYIAHLREVGRYSTAKSYLDALRSFKCFCGMEEIPYAYIDKERLLLYQAWLSKRAVCAIRFPPICGESGISITWRWRLASFVYPESVQGGVYRRGEQAEEGVASG